MGVLEQVTQMRNEGKTDEEIISDLKKQKVSPKEINDALNHAQIKSAVADINSGSSDMAPPPAPSAGGSYPEQQGYSQYPEQGNFDSGNYGQQYPQQQGYSQYPEQGFPQEGQQFPSEQAYSPSEQGGYYQQGYDQYSQPASNTDTIVEVSEQVFEDKSRGITKKMDSFEEFRTLTQTRLDHINEKVKRIESVLDKLQAAILEKVGSYGQDLSHIKKEMSMMQDTFTKTLDPLVEMAKGKSSRKKSSKK